MATSIYVLLAASSLYSLINLLPLVHGDCPPWLEAQCYRYADGVLSRDQSLLWQMTVWCVQS